MLTARVPRVPRFFSSQAKEVPAGEFLRGVRTRLQLGVREVQEASAVIALERGHPGFYLAASRLTQIEKGESVPGIFKLFSLCSVYEISLYELLRRYGCDPDEALAYRDRFFPQTTRPACAEVHGDQGTIPVPIRLDPTFSWETTQLVNRVVALWGELPAAFLIGLNPRRHAYAHIGLNDRTMYPLIRPGSLIMIDPERRKVTHGVWTDELERPIYFVELRDGYRCAWCEVDGSRLVMISHRQSGEPVRTLSLATEAEIVGQVVGVAMRLVPAGKPTPGPATRPPKPIEVVK